MRIHIRTQLGCLVTFVALCCVGIPSVISWIINYHFVTNQRLGRLSLIADFKSQQLVQSLTILQNSIESISSRVLIQNALRKYNDDGKYTEKEWRDPLTDLSVALSTQSYLIQGTLYNNNLTQGLLNVTTRRALDIDGITTATGSLGALGDDVNSGYNWNGHTGFPDELYPRSTIVDDTNPTMKNLITPQLILKNQGILLGPVKSDYNSYTASYTIPILDSGNNTGVLLGFLTVLFDAELLIDLALAIQGFDSSEELIVLGPDIPTNRWHVPFNDTNPGKIDSLTFRYVLPPSRHPDRFNTTSTLGQYSTAKIAFAMDTSQGTGNNLDTRNPQGTRVSVGYALPNITIVDWIVIIEESRSELLSPVTRLRNVLLATVFGTCGIVVLLVFPLAHLFVRPIRRLTWATKHSQSPASFSPHAGNSGTDLGVYNDKSNENGNAQLPFPNTGAIEGDKRQSQDIDRVVTNGPNEPFSRNHKYTTSEKSNNSSSRVRAFRVPSKVSERKHIIYDELTDLTHTFNEMTEELVQQYERQEDRVRQRTKQLIEAREIAESANEAKSRFIANITHELRTPLNGILGMCAVCLADDDINRIKQSLGIVNKSGELLLHLLNDLLSFSKTQFGGHAIKLDNTRFQMLDITSQIVAIFDKQARDSQIQLHIDVLPDKTVLRKTVWGDTNRILQVVINLVNNGLKFTPEHGAVKLRISLGEEVPTHTLEPQQRGSVSSSINLHHQNSRSSSFRHPISILKHRGSSSQTYVAKVSDTNTLTKSPSPDDCQSDDGLLSQDFKVHIFEFQVEDTGPGIPLDQQEKIFEPFVQGDLGLNKKYGGTGLGLSICRQLATLMNGSISLESQEGHGCTFTLRIPLQVKMDETPAPSRNNSRTGLDAPGFTDSTTTDPSLQNDQTPTLDINNPSSNKLTYIPQPRLVGLSQPFFAPSHINGTSDKDVEISNKKKVVINDSPDEKSDYQVRVLVAEDNKINQEVIRRMLKPEMIFNITVAKDGMEAVARVKDAIDNNYPFDIVFMDVQMPNLDGLESTRIIRNLGYSAPIIALSALTDETNIKECLDSGMNHFLSKPISRPALKKVLKTYCGTIQEEVNETKSTKTIPSPISSTSAAAIS